jgi:adenosine deaminase
MRYDTLLLAAALCLGPAASAQARPAETPRTQRAARAFAAAKSSPLELHAFLARMPKGADLHMHLSGAIYAESFLSQAIDDNLCIDTLTLSLVRDSSNQTCGSGQVPAGTVLKDQRLYDALIDSFSMRGFVPTSGTTGHDQFFATFARFGGLKDHAGEWLDEVATRAAEQNEQYLEIMQTPTFMPAATLGKQIGWPDGVLPEGTFASYSLDTTDARTIALAKLRDQLLASPTFRENIAQDRLELAGALAGRNRIEHCGTPEARPGCTVQVQFLGQVLRANPPEQVFAQTLLYFELASTDPDVVGINFVQPEDARLAMAEYYRQMLMLEFLHGLYPKVHISLHAGELAPGMVPPEGLREHIWEAVTLAGAERIGHGVDAMQEHDPHALLKLLADRHVMVEINLTSNDVILGVVPPNHPLPAYRAAHVPVALSTDDEGVSRIDLTHEYTRAALEYHLGYLDLKAMARTSLEHSFLPGPSLWEKQDSFTRTVPACATQPAGAEKPTAKCAGFLKSSEKATQQWELERRYTAFEAALP